MRLYNAGLISLLCACSPKTSMIYMNSEMDNPDSRTYAVSDSDNKIKREILEADNDKNLPWYFKQRLMTEVDRRGLVVRTRELENRTEVTVFFPILYGRRDWLKEYYVKGYFKLSIDLFDYGNDGTIDGLMESDRERFRNIIRASERVLKSENSNSKP